MNLKSCWLAGLLCFKHTVCLCVCLRVLYVAFLGFHQLLHAYTHTQTHTQIATDTFVWYLFFFPILSAVERDEEMRKREGKGETTGSTSVLWSSLRSVRISTCLSCPCRDSTCHRCTSSPPCCASPAYCPQSRSCRTASHTGAGSSLWLWAGTKTLLLLEQVWFPNWGSGPSSKKKTEGVFYYFLVFLSYTSSEINHTSTVNMLMTVAHTEVFSVTMVTPPFCSESLLKMHHYRWSSAGKLPQT